jgi:uncharacterized HAD superfamily protein
MEPKPRTHRGRIYVDIDDVLSHTAESLIDLLEVHHGRRVELEDFAHFDIGLSLGLNEEEATDFLHLAHQSDSIEGIRPVTGAAETLRAWGESGYEVALLTGRPPITDPSTRNWLLACDIHFESLGFVDKYGRGDTWDESIPSLSLDDVRAMEFCLAVEDSADMAIFLVDELGVDVVLIDRPWNRELPASSRRGRGTITRCHSWGEVGERFPNP